MHSILIIPAKVIKASRILPVTASREITVQGNYVRLNYSNSNISCYRTITGTR